MGNAQRIQGAKREAARAVTSIRCTRCSQAPSQRACPVCNGSHQGQVEQAAKQGATAQANKAVIEEWRAAIERLFAQLRAWLAKSDPDGIIEIEESQEDVREPGLGRYRVPRLNLRAFGKWIGIIPKARRTVGTATPPLKLAPERAAGRVDITDELRRYVLYWFPEDSRDVWLIDDLNSEPKLLDQEAFERALISYLR